MLERVTCSSFRSAVLPKSPADNVISLYREHAAAFEKNRSHELVERVWLNRFLELLPNSRPDVLGIGCGSGTPMARYLIQKGCRITGWIRRCPCSRVRVRRFRSNAGSRRICARCRSQGRSTVCWPGIGFFIFPLKISGPCLLPFGGWRRRVRF